MSEPTEVAEAVAAAVSDIVPTPSDALVPLESGLEDGRHPIAAAGCNFLNALLDGLMAVFPEKTTLAVYTAAFRSGILGNPDQEVWIMKKWHADMTTVMVPTSATPVPRRVTVYDMFARRDMDAVFDAGVGILDDMDAASMYWDPAITDEDRDIICKHFDRVNRYARAMAVIPETLMRRAMDVAKERPPGSEPMTSDSAWNMCQKMLGGSLSDPETMDQVMTWSSHFLNHIADIPAVLELANSATAGGGGNMFGDGGIAGLQERVFAEMSGAESLIASKTPTGETAPDVSQLMSLLSAMSPPSSTGASGGAKRSAAGRK